MQRRIYRAVLKTGMEQAAIETLKHAKPSLINLSADGSVENPSLFRFNKLTTQNTPMNWGEVMGRHFKKWADQRANDDNWRDCEVILTLY